MAEESQLVNVWDFEEAARQRLSAMAFDYFASGAHDEITLRENHAAYDRIALLYHVLRDVSQRSFSTTVLGHPISMPILVAPMAFHGMAHTDAEPGTARAAGTAGTIMVVSTMSNTTVEEIAAAASGPLWFQLYMYRDRGATTDLVRRVEAAGYQALMLTVDAPLLGRRERDVRNRFTLPPGLHVRNLTAAGVGELPQVEESGLAAYFASLLDQSLSWKDVEWLQSLTSLPVLIKGVVRGGDAAHAAELGVVGIVVSNHGGRQLDTAPATIDMLPEVVESVDGRAEVLIDGGIRRGTDVVKALALGARAVMVGRPILWGLSALGEAGVARVLEMLRVELDEAMALCGCAQLSELTPDLVQFPLHRRS